jgi:hypothetical protein
LSAGTEAGAKHKKQEKFLQIKPRGWRTQVGHSNLQKILYTNIFAGQKNMTRTRRHCYKQKQAISWII